MPSIGPLEFLMVAVIALIVFGPQKLPEIARTVGRFMNQVRQMAMEVKSEFDAGLSDDEDEPVADEDAGAIEDAAGRTEPDRDTES